MPYNGRATILVNGELASMGKGLHEAIPMYFVELRRWQAVTNEGVMVGSNVLVYDLAKRARESGASWLCVSGEEPFEQPLLHLMSAAKWLGLKTAVETSGEPGTWQDLGDKLDWMTLVPRKQTIPQKEFIDRANEIRCLMTRPRDVEYYTKNYNPAHTGKPLILLPP